VFPSAEVGPQKLCIVVVPYILQQVNQLLLEEKKEADNL